MKHLFFFFVVWAIVFGIAPAATVRAEPDPEGPDYPQAWVKFDQERVWAGNDVIVTYGISDAIEFDVVCWIGGEAFGQYTAPQPPTAGTITEYICDPSLNGCTFRWVGTGPARFVVLAKTSSAAPSGTYRFASIRLGSITVPGNLTVVKPYRIRLPLVQR